MFRSYVKKVAIKKLVTSERSGQIIKLEINKT